MDKEKKLKDVKSMLRAVLMSSKEGVVADRLSREYRGICMEPLPFRELGFKSLDEFILAVPDVARLGRSKDGQVAYFSVADASTAHIQKMVQAQKSTKKRGKPLRSSRRPTFHGPSHFNRFGPRLSHTPRGPPPQRRTFEPKPKSFPPVSKPFANQGSNYGGLKITVTNKHGSNKGNTFGSQQTNIFGSTYKVPPRFKNRLGAPPAGSESYPEEPFARSFSPPPSTKSSTPAFTGRPADLNPIQVRQGVIKKDYKSLLAVYASKQKMAPLVYETGLAGKDVQHGFISSVKINKRIFGSLDKFASKKEAEQAAARNAVEQLNVESADIKKIPKSKKKKTPATGPNFSEMSLGLGSDEDSEAEEYVAVKLNFDKAVIKERIRQIVSKKPNGLFLTRLPFEYKSIHDEVFPPDAIKLLDQWADIVRVESGVGDMKILFPVAGSSPVVAPTPATQPAPQRAPQDPAPSARTVVMPAKETNGHAYINITEDVRVPPPHLPLIRSNFRVLISNTESIDDFYVQISANSQLLTEFSKQLNDIYEASVPPKVLSKPEVGTYCAVCFEYEGEPGWYRAKITDCTSGIEGNREYTVLYIDFGNSEKIKANRPRRLLPKLAEVPAQAIKCTLDGVFPKGGDKWSDEAIDEFTKATVEQELIIEIIDIEDGVCVVEMYLPDSDTYISDLLHEKGYAVRTKEVTLQEPAPLKLPEDNMWDVYVTYISNPTSIMIRLIGEEYSDKLSTLEEEMDAYYAKNPHEKLTNPPEVGNVYTFFDEDSLYRVRVLKSPTDEGVQCFFLDHGDTDYVELKEFYHMKPEFLKLPYQAKECSLCGLNQLTNNEKVLDKLISMALAKCCIAEVVERGERISVKLFDTSGEEDIYINDAVTVDVLDTDLAPQIPEVGGVIEGYVSYMTENGLLYFQIIGPGLDRLEELMVKITDHYSKHTAASEFVSNPQVNQICCAKYSLDNNWYRAKITELLPDRQVAVHFVDYGNSDIVPYHALREMTEENGHLKTLPFQAVPFTLHGLPPSGGVWSEEAICRVEGLTPSEDVLTLQVVASAEEKTRPMSAMLFVIEGEQKISLLEILSNEPQLFMPPVPSDNNPIDDISNEMAHNLHLDTVDSPVLTPEPPGPDGDGIKNKQKQNPSRYIASMPGSCDDNDNVTSEIIELDHSATNDTIEVISLNSSASDKDESVIFIEERPPSNEARTVTPTCIIEKSPPLDTTPDKATCMGANIIKLSIPMRSGEIPIKGKSDISGEINSLPVPPKLVLPPPGEYWDCNVTYVCDPSNFICIPFESMSDLTVMMKGLSDYYSNPSDLTMGELQVGQLCAAFYENLWYRATIHAVLGNMKQSTLVSVYFVDYGDFGVVPKKHLKPLVTQFRQLPYQATRVQLQGIKPVTGDTWTEESKMRFQDIVMEKDFVALIKKFPSDEPEDNKVPKVSVQLIDTSGDSDIIIHNILVEEGYAVLS
ncbi:unnamed protein product [Owenia fusiformis]|uniref:Uncharacterized protein n=1 Tax=Owenia fusiformis TaxID=6347 RepID=A0A8J1U808_OWEFU|nr:unnamed protein product [Owenia fusiformis]